MVATENSIAHFLRAIVCFSRSLSLSPHCRCVFVFLTQFLSACVLFYAVELYLRPPHPPRKHAAGRLCQSHVRKNTHTHRSPVLHGRLFRYNFPHKHKHTATQGRAQSKPTVRQTDARIQSPPLHTSRYAPMCNAHCDTRTDGRTDWLLAAVRSANRTGARSFAVVCRVRSLDGYRAKLYRCTLVCECARPHSLSLCGIKCLSWQTKHFQFTYPQNASACVRLVSEIDWYVH